ncbi:MAG: hypothetical protein II353_04465, partial [Alistipes sp.]|nr:hypothetical protein [Alistipes sp.]
LQEQPSLVPSHMMSQTLVRHTPTRSQKMVSAQDGLDQSVGVEISLCSLLFLGKAVCCGQKQGK